MNVAGTRRTRDGRGARIGAVIVVTALLGAPVAEAQADLAPEIRAALMVKILQYDRATVKRTGGAVLVVAGRAGAPDDTCALMAKALQEAARHVPAGGAPVRVTSGKAGSPAGLEALLVNESATALYLCPSLEPAVTDLAPVTRKLRVITFSGSEAAARAGVSVAVFPRGARPVVAIHLAHAREEGAEFDADLLRVSEVTR